MYWLALGAAAGALTWLFSEGESESTRKTAPRKKRTVLDENLTELSERLGATGAHVGHRDHVNRFIVDTRIGLS